MSDFEAGGRIHRRAAFFAGMASRHLTAFPGIADRTEFRADSPVILSWCYFLLSDAYKAKRNQPGSLTDVYKRAALSAIAVMAIRPFSPLHADKVDRLDVYLANPILALACANAWAAERNLFQYYPHDYLKRFYLSLLNVRISGTDGFVARVNAGEDYRDCRSIELAPKDMVVLDEWVLKIWMLSNQKR